jgi:low affinity Fe/Cu permease
MDTTHAHKRKLPPWFDKFSRWSAAWTGSTPAFLIAVGVILVWGVTGPIFGFSDTWQLVINTGTTIVTFLMVFLIQHAQNRDSLAIQLKLNELIAAVKGASNRLISVEEMTDEELQELRASFQKLAESAERDNRPGLKHSLEEIQEGLCRSANPNSIQKEGPPYAGRN